MLLDAPLLSEPLLVPSVPPVPPVPVEPPGEVRMTTRRVRATLARILIGATPDTTERGLASRFRHRPEAGADDEPTQGRDFYIAWDDASTRGPYTPLGSSNRRWDTVRIVVVYPDDYDDAKIEDVMADDYDRISARLLDPALWEQPVSTIINVVRDDGELIPARFTRAPGRRLVTITLRVEHTR